MGSSTTLAGHPRLTLTDQAKRDLDSGLVDPQLIRLLEQLLERHSLSVRVIKSGHPKGPKTPVGQVNAHYFYRAADIDAVDGLHE